MAHATTHRLRVRYAECDQLGIVFNANFFLYFDIAITELFRDAGLSYAEMADRDIETAVLEASARFRSPARFDDVLDVHAEVEHLGRTSLVTAYRVLNGETLVCEGRLVHVFVDRRSHQKLEMPADVRQSLAGSPAQA